MGKYSNIINEANKAKGVEAEPETPNTGAESELEPELPEEGDTKTSEGNTRIQETRKLDSYTKVAMRLSTDAADTLKRWRLETGLPYEILVDVLIRNQGEFPPGLLDEAKTIRNQRLLEGKQKSLNNAQQK